MNIGYACPLHPKSNDWKKNGRVISTVLERSPKVYNSIRQLLLYAGTLRRGRKN
jgi:hypothetical protein